MVVDLTDQGSIEMAGTWKQDVYNNSFYTDESFRGQVVRERKKSMRSQIQIPVLLVGNKVDKVPFFHCFLIIVSEATDGNDALESMMDL